MDIEKVKLLHQRLQHLRMVVEETQRALKEADDQQTAAQTALHVARKEYLQVQRECAKEVGLLEDLRLLWWEASWSEAERTISETNTVAVTRE